MCSFLEEWVHFNKGYYEGNKVFDVLFSLDGASCILFKVLSTMNPQYNSIRYFPSVKELCTSCGHLCTWNSQPCIGKGVLPAGYLLLSASILYAGASPTQVLRTCTGVPIRSHHHTASICQIPVTLSHAISIKSVGKGEGSTHCRGSEQMLATKPWGRWT